MNLWKRIRKLLFGSYKVALEDGLIAEEGVSVMGGGLWQRTLFDPSAPELPNLHACYFYQP